MTGSPDDGRSARRFDGLLTAAQAARRLGITSTELLRLAHAKRLRHVVIEGSVHVSESALDEYLRRHPPP